VRVYVLIQRFKIGNYPIKILQDGLRDIRIRRVHSHDPPPSTLSATRIARFQHSKEAYAGGLQFDRAGRKVNRFERRKFVARAPLQHFAIQLYVRLWQMLFKKSPALRDLPW
jgi:hypothetical protein